MERPPPPPRWNFDGDGIVFYPLPFFFIYLLSPLVETAFSSVPLKYLGEGLPCCD